MSPRKEKGMAVAQRQVVWDVNNVVTISLTKSECDESLNAMKILQTFAQKEKEKETEKEKEGDKNVKERILKTF